MRGSDAGKKLGKHASHATNGSNPTTPNRTAPREAKTTTMPKVGQAPVSPAQFGVVGASDVALKPKRSKKPLFITLAVIFGILLVVYLGGAWFFSSHFMPNTSLNDEDLSFEPAETLVQQVQSQAEAYTLTLEGEGFSYEFAQGQTALTIDAQSIADEALEEQGAFTWPVGVFQMHDISNAIVASFDEAAFNETINTQVAGFNEGQTASVDASIIYDESLDDFSIQPETYGTQLDAALVSAKAVECVKTMRTECEITTDEQIKPVIQAADPRMIQALQSVKDMYPGDITLMLNGSVEATTITKANFAPWVVINTEDFSVSLNQEQMAAWADETCSSMNTVGTTRTWTREDGKVCTVSGGTWGWEVDTTSLATTIVDAVNNGTTTVDIPCSQSGDVYNGAGARDWGAYIDVDLSEQQVRYYGADGTLLYQCNCISGKPTSKRATPTGVYYLNSNRSSPATLTGYENGQKTYETKVTYWMPFVGNSVGLHDATWQSWGSWSASRYQTNGSHGCVNLSLSDAQWFYNNVSTGVCVISHD